MPLTKPKQFTVHDTEVVTEKNGIIYRYSIGYVCGKRVGRERVNRALGGGEEYGN